MRVLLDTHTFLWWNSSRGSRLSVRARELIEDGATVGIISVVTAYEIAVKAARGTLELPMEPSRYVPDRMSRSGFEALAVELRHVLVAGALPPIHRDPFDRLLVGQAQVEGLAIVTADPAIAQYDVETIW